MNRLPVVSNQMAWLRAQLEIWRERGLMTADQVAGILDLYETPQEMAARKAARGIFALLAVAGLFFGLGAFLLIGFNWEALPAFAKLTLIVGTVLLTHGLAFGLRDRWGRPRAAEVAFFVACLLYGGGIFLIGQVFHVDAHWPDGLWWWALGVLPFALVLETPLTHALFATLLAMWAGTEVLGFNVDLPPELWGFWAGQKALSLPLLAAPALVWTYRKRSATALALYVPVVCWWVFLQMIAWRVDANPVYLVGAIGALLLLLAETEVENRRFAIVYRVWGLLQIGAVLVALSFYDFNREIAREAAQEGVHWISGLPALAQPLLIAVLAAAGVAVVAQRGSALGPSYDRLRRLWLPAVLLALMAILSLATILSGTGAKDASGSVMPAALLATIAANAGMLVVGVWLIGKGLREDRGAPFAFGVAYLLLWACLRYADLFSSFGGMVGAALMFILCGTVLVAVAMYWRRRREVFHA